jgi:GNAT superfamily N-acetyltransferase
MQAAIPALAELFVEAWGPYYGPAGPGDAEHDIRSCCNRDVIPLALVALDTTQNILGTAALKPHSLDTHRHLSPWLAALLVAPGQRGRGIVSALITAIEDEARRLGFDSLYSDTASGSTLLERRGWQKLQTDIQTLREPATLYRLDLKAAR